MRFNEVRGLRKPREINAFAADYDDPKIVKQTHRQAARRNPAWKRSLVYIMASYGFGLIGAGINGAVFHRDGSPFVLKVYRTDHGYDEWLYFVRTHRDNRYVPKLRGQPVRLNKTFRVVRMELLEPCPHDVANAFIERVEAVMDTVGSIRNRDRSDPDLFDVAKVLHDWEGHGDLTAHNVMQRPNGDVVILDPIYIDPSKPLDD